MTITKDNLDKLARLAYLEVDKEQHTQLTKEINDIIDFVEALRSVDTKQIAPLFHPFDLHQPLRTDEVTEKSCLEELAAIAPIFEDDYYLVPKVLETGN